MGKSKNILQKARKEYFKSLEKKLDKNKYEEEENIEEDGESEAERRVKFINVAHEIHSELLAYSRNNSMPLCEYLNIENVENYISWLKS